MSKPKIYCFQNVVGGGEGLALAIAEDGNVLASHWCSHECYVCGDLGVDEGSRPDHHARYAKHYPDGYEMEFVPAAKVKKHEGLTLAIERNRALSKREKQC